MNDRYMECALMFKALSDPNRLIIIKYLIGGECCACVLLEQLHITQPTLSYHMKMLTDCDIVQARKEGKWMHYSINKSRIKLLKEVLDEFME